MTAPGYIEPEYLHLDSTYRDLTDNPNPASFRADIHKIYQGSRTLNEARIMGVKLKRLYLPDIAAGGGENGIDGTTRYVFVSLSSQNEKHTKILTTNNTSDNVKRAVFEVPIDVSFAGGGGGDFLILDECNMTQRYKFKLDDTINLSIILPDGTPMLYDDTGGPDPNKQIQVLFELVPLRLYNDGD